MTGNFPAFEPSEDATLMTLLLAVEEATNDLPDDSVWLRATLEVAATLRRSLRLEVAS